MKNNRQLVIEIFEKNPKLFIDLVSENYAMNEDIIDLNIDLWDWKKISLNNNIEWNSNLFNRYENLLNFDFKFSNHSEQFSLINPIERIDNEIKNVIFGRWENLIGFDKLNRTIELLEEFKNKLNWYELSNNKHLPWSIQLLESFEDKWDWDILSGYKDWGENKEWIFFWELNEISWTFELIENFENKWNWRTISCNGDYYNLRKSGMNVRKSSPFNLFPWSIDIIERFEKKLDWSLISQNPKLPWSEKLIDKYIQKWNWDKICENIGIPWTRELIFKYYKFIEKPFDWTRKNWNSLGHCDSPQRFLNPAWEQISYSTKINWSIELLEEFEDLFNFENVLSKRSDLPWSEELIDKFFNRWDWRYLTSNKGIYWDSILIDKYEDKLHFKYLYKKSLLSDKSK